MKEKKAAHDAVMWALKIGRLIRPEACSLCLKACKPDAHHEDWAKKLDVVWLCRRCHRVIHPGMDQNAIQRKQNSYAATRQHALVASVASWRAKKSAIA